MKQNLNKKIARLINISNWTGEAIAPHPAPLPLPGTPMCITYSLFDTGIT